MSLRSIHLQRDEIVHEAARIICEEAVLDYRLAKQKAAQRLGLGLRAALPDNARVQAAVIDYQRLYGGQEYAQRLQALRQVAVQAMRLLKEFSPRLVGAVANGATSRAHRVQLHAFAERSEAIDLFLEDRGIPYRQGERGYRYADGVEVEIPLVRFEAGEIGVDVAVFGPGEERRAPLSPGDGLPVKRLTLAEAEALARLTPDAILALPAT